MIGRTFVAVSGLPGLYKLMATRSNGLLLQELDSEKTKFASARKHQFTPLESVAIYTDNDSVELSVIFDRIKSNEDSLEMPASSASKDEFFDYFSEILPDYDEERVLISDVKKVIKWYRYLSERNLLSSESEDKEGSNDSVEEDEEKE